MTELDRFPPVMQARHIAELLNVVVRTVNRRCSAKTMRPAPESWQKPYVWYRERLRAELQAGAARHPFSPHGRLRRRRRSFERVREIRDGLDR